MADLLKELQKKHRGELQRLDCLEKKHIQVLAGKHRATYETLETEQERAASLLTYVHKLRQLKQGFACKQQRLLDRQTKQRKKLVEQLTPPADLERQWRMKCALTVIEAVGKSNLTLGVVTTLNFFY